MWTVNTLIVVMCWLITKVGDFSCNSEKINIGCAMVENDEFTGMRKLYY